MGWYPAPETDDEREERERPDPASPVVNQPEEEPINWKVVGVLIEAHMAASRYHSPGTSNWGAALYKALRREFPARDSKEN